MDNILGIFLSQNFDFRPKVRLPTFPHKNTFRGQRKHPHPHPKAFSWSSTGIQLEFNFGVRVRVFCLPRRPMEVQQGSENPPNFTKWKTTRRRFRRCPKWAALRAALLGFCCLPIGKEFLCFEWIFGALLDIRGLQERQNTRTHTRN